jgi:hypothetical protein
MALVVEPRGVVARNDVHQGDALQAQLLSRNGQRLRCGHHGLGFESCVDEVARALLERGANGRALRRLDDGLEEQRHLAVRELAQEELHGTHGVHVEVLDEAFAVRRRIGGAVPAVVVQRVQHGLELQHQRHQRLQEAAVRGQQVEQLDDGGGDADLRRVVNHMHAHVQRARR